MSAVEDARNRLVVVISPVTNAYNEESKFYAARFAELGLTSFGPTVAQATRRLKSLFKTFIHTHRELGALAETLDKFGVEWYWADEYPDGKPVFENTNNLMDVSVGVGNPPAHARLPTGEQPHGDGCLEKLWPSLPSPPWLKRIDA